MSSTEDVAEQQKLLQTHRATLSHYLYQRATHGTAYVPPGVIHGITEARNNIRRIKKLLRDWAIPTEDHPNDEEERTLPIDNQSYQLFWEHIRLYPILEASFIKVNYNRDLVPQQYRDMITGIQRIAEGLEHRNYVAVLGSGLMDTPKRQKLCEVIGSFLGKSEHVLIRAASDVGQEVAKAFYAVNTRPGYLLNYREKGKDHLPYGSMVYFNDMKELRQALTNNADFFIVIGGSKGTAGEIKLAKEKGKEVFVFREDLLQ